MSIEVHPTNGCIMVSNVTTLEQALEKTREALAKSSNIDCDWIDGILIESDDESSKTIDIHPTNGCITVKDVSSVNEAMNKIALLLSDHDDVYCDWIDGIEIEQDEK